jgi:hypothetical protein
MSFAMSRFRTGVSTILLVSALVLVCSLPASAVVKKWIGHTDYSLSGAATYPWTTTTYWNTSSVPSSADYVVIGECGNAPLNCSFFPTYDNLPPKVIDLGMFG